MWYGILADISALAHGLVVLYIAGGFLAIVAGLWRRWAFVRRFWFRITHLALCLGVAALELFNRPCPLTTLEQWLREQQDANSAYAGSFIAHYVHAAIHFQVQPSALAAPMLAFVAVVVLLYLWRGPERPGK
ncbi:MAG: DUF2784 domain-containing protein [Planctomycetota bacterium]